MTLLRSYIRFIFFVLAVIVYLLRYMISTIFTGRDLEKGLILRHKFAKTVNWLLNIELEVKGRPVEQPALYVSNHRTYYDPGAVVHHLIKAVVVAKAEIRDWPLIGYAVDFTGIIFVKRENKDSRHATRVAMAKALEDGFSVLIYPEGTTGDRPTTLEFKPGTFATAIKMNTPIIPVAVEYDDPVDAWVIPTETFPHHFIHKTFKKRKTRVKLRYGAPIFENDVELFRDKVRAWIDENLLEMQAEFGGVAWPATV